MFTNFLSIGSYSPEVGAFGTLITSIKVFRLTVFHRSIAAATNYFVLQVPEATIRGRRLFEGGDYSRAASIKEYCHTITFITSYKFVPSFIVILFLINVSIYVLFICLDPLSLNAAS